MLSKQFWQIQALPHAIAKKTFPPCILQMWFQASDSLIQPRGSSMWDFQTSWFASRCTSVSVCCKYGNTLLRLPSLSEPSCRTMVWLQKSFVQRRSHRTIVVSLPGNRAWLQVLLVLPLMPWEVNVCHAKHSWSVCHWSIGPATKFDSSEKLFSIEFERHLLEAKLIFFCAQWQ